MLTGSALSRTNLAARLGILLMVSLVAAHCAGDDDTGEQDDENASIRYYETPAAKATGEPGELIAEEPIALAGLDGDGRRITYASTTPRGDVVHVTGVLIVPDGGPDDEHPVAVWGHPTVGVGSECAPSLDEPFSLDGAQQLLDAGFIVAAPDYDGLGSEGTHPYLVGESEARTVLDIARAARTAGGNDAVVTWGHSQGGHAVLWARSIAGDYAPELDLRGTAAAAPPTDLAAFLNPGFIDPRLVAITAQTAFAWGTVHENADLAPLATDAALAAAAEVVVSCFVELAAVTSEVEPDAIWAAGPDDVPGWGELTAANSVDPDRGEGAVFLSHGDADVVIPIDGTLALAAALCDRGESVVQRTDPAWTHGTAYSEVRDEMFGWLIGAVEATPASEC